MANKTTKKDTTINVQPLRDEKEIAEFREALKVEGKKPGQQDQSDRNLLLFTIGVNTGLRIGDIVKLRVADVKGQSSIVMKEGKTDKARTVYLGEIMSDIADYLADKPSEGYLFPSRKGDSHISTTQAYRILTNAGKSIGRDDIGSHTLRKSFGYHYYYRTKDVYTLMDIFNHDSQQTTKRYIGVRQKDIEDSLKGFRL